MSPVLLGSPQDPQANPGVADTRVVALASPSHAVDRIPNELLTIIFGYCIAYSGFQRNFLKWTLILFVCRRWYWTGVQCPALWTAVSSLQDIECTREVLRRSQGLPLHIDIRHIDKDNFDVPLMILQELWRAKTLYINTPGPLYYKVADAIAAVSRMDRLERLDMKFVESPPDVRIVGAGSHITLSDFFRCPLPRLKQASIIVNCGMAGMLVAPNLEDLELDVTGECEADGGCFIDLKDLATALRGMPHLAHFSMSNLYPSIQIDDTAVATAIRVDLPSLCSLSLSGDVVPYIQLPDLYSVPTTASIALSLITSSVDELDLVTDGVRKLFTPSNLPNERMERREIRSLSVSGEAWYDHGWVLAVESSPHETAIPPMLIDEPLPDSNFWIRVKHFCEDASEDPPELKLLDVLPLENVCSLTVVGDTAKDTLVPDSMRKAFLDEIWASGPREYEPVSPDTAGSEDTNTWQQIFPKLQVVAFYPDSKWEDP